MPNLFERLFLSRYKLNILKTIEAYSIKRDSRNWTETQYKTNRIFNRSSNKFSVIGNGIKIEADREYEEKLEASLMPATYFVLSVYPSDDINNPTHREFDTQFAQKVYKKMLEIYMADKHNAR